MARARNIKPGFFKNEDLAECSPLARILFAGLWCLADRAGRLEDRPKRIRAEVLPYDDGSVDDMLNELHKAGFVLRYQVGDDRFIQVLNFAKHQNPHHREVKSTIPAPEMPDCPINDQGKPGASPGLSPDKSGTSRADSLNLIPDSLNPSSEADASVVASKLDDDVEKAAIGIPDCPQQEVIAMYGEVLPALPQPRAWEGQRANNLKARWRWVLTAKTSKGKRYATDKGSALDFFRRFFQYVAESDFLTGRDGKWQGCNLGWLVKAENFAKVLEGHYENREAA